MERVNCNKSPAGTGVCDMCASGRPELCRYVNTIGAIKEIDRLRAELADKDRAIQLALNHPCANPEHIFLLNDLEKAERERNEYKTAFLEVVELRNDMATINDSITNQLALSNRALELACDDIVEANGNKESIEWWIDYFRKQAEAEG